MRRATLIVDGLWYCLCPPFYQPALRPPFTSFVSKQARPARCPIFHPATSAVRATRRYSSLGASDGTRTAATSQGLSENETGDSRLNEQSPIDAKDAQGDGGKPKFRNKRFNTYGPKLADVPRDIRRRSTEDLEDFLKRSTSKNSPKLLTVTAILRVLIGERHIQPQVRHYKALILAHADPRYGSPENVRQLLREMEENGVAADSSTLHAALQALAVHPDYLLRQEILRTLRDRWLPLSPDGWHSVVAGLIREEQYELALDHLDHMVTMGIPVQNWLHGLLVYSLCELEDFDQVLKLMKSRVTQQQDISMDLWTYVLEAASEALHHEMSSYVWKQVVESGYLDPSHGVCSNVLTIASRIGDVQLATSVIRFLIKAEVLLSLEDYEKLADTYVMAGDLDAAFDTLCSMHDAGIRVEETSTRSILTYMVQRKMEPQNIWKGLKRLKAQGRNVPLACANVIIEYCEHHLSLRPGAVATALKFYKELYELCPGGADVTTYNRLISLCRRAKRPDACMFVVKEMAALGVSPDSNTFARLILMCLDLGNFRSAYMYFQDFLERGWTLDERTCGEVRELCRGSEDEFAVRFLEHSMVS